MPYRLEARRVVIEDSKGIRHAVFMAEEKFKTLDKTEEVVIQAIRSAFGAFRSHLIQANGSLPEISWISFQMFTKKDKDVYGQVQIGLGISFDFLQKDTDVEER